MVNVAEERAKRQGDETQFKIIEKAIVELKFYENI